MEHKKGEEEGEMNNSQAKLKARNIQTMIPGYFNMPELMLAGYSYVMKNAQLIFVCSRSNYCKKAQNSFFFTSSLIYKLENIMALTSSYTKNKSVVRSSPPFNMVVIYTSNQVTFTDAPEHQ